METADAILGLDCRGCGERIDLVAAGLCPECGGSLDLTYDYDTINISRPTLEARPFTSMWRYGEVLPFPQPSAVTMNEGVTPIVDCPQLADAMGVGRVIIKDEGRNPTGTVRDREHSVAITAAQSGEAEHIALASTGDGGQSAAAYAARAGMQAHVFLPSRAGFTRKAMVNVHGADLTVVEGRLPHATDAFYEALTEHGDWISTAPFDTPYRLEGMKTIGYELLEQLGWAIPDAIVYPTGTGMGLIGIHKAATELRAFGMIDELPALYAAQATGCAPIAGAWTAGDQDTETWENPDTICGGIEVPDPTAGAWVLEAIRQSDGGAVSTPDAAILDSAATVAARTGLEIGATAAAAAGGAYSLAEEEMFDPDATVVIVNTGSGNKDADIIRSHLMTQGV